MVSDMEELQKKLKRWSETPLITETGPQTGANSPVMEKIRLKRRIQYAALCLIGILPWCVRAWLGIPLPPRLIRCFLGLVVPGGGFFSWGTWQGVLLGIAVLMCFFTIGRKVIELYGNIALMAALWLAGAAGGLLKGGDVGPPALLLPMAAAAVSLGYFEFRQKLLERRILRDRARRTERFSEIMEPVEKLCREGETDQKTAAVKNTEQQDYRELDERGLKAAGYLFDMTLREKGDFTDYNKTSINSMGAYRYQFAALGYALMLMQCKYTPNFHGYQNRAWRFLIEAFTDPRCCGYWKWECLGGHFRWNPDPVERENIMLRGGLLRGETVSGANPNDRRYEKEGSIRFRPFKGEGKREYAYSAGSLTELLARQWKESRYPAVLIPCEPHIAFPICNSYGMLGTMIYDRDHNTSYAADILDQYNEALKREFVEADGCVADMRHYLFGACRFMHKPAMNVSPIGGISLGLEYEPIYPGLARRCFALVKDEVVGIKDGMAYLKSIPWEQAVDLGTMTKNPSMYCGLLEQAAAEYGDYELLEALEAVERHYLKASKNPRILRYKDVAVINMAYLCLSKWARKGDWFDTIHKGPAAQALAGPVLDECSYPDVMVARAVSTDGSDLELVLCSGSEKKEQQIGIARLKPLQAYVAEGIGQTFRADHTGRAVLRVILNGRTKIRIRRE